MQSFSLDLCVLRIIKPMRTFLFFESVEMICASNFVEAGRIGDKEISYFLLLG